MNTIDSGNFRRRREDIKSLSFHPYLVVCQCQNKQGFEAMSGEGGIQIFCIDMYISREVSGLLTNAQLYLGDELLVSSSSQFFHRFHFISSISTVPLISKLVD